MKYFIVEDPYESSYLWITNAETIADAEMQYHNDPWRLRNETPEEANDCRLLSILFDRVLTNEDAAKVFEAFPEFKQKLDAAIESGRL